MGFLVTYPALSFLLSLAVLALLFLIPAPFARGAGSLTSDGARFGVADRSRQVVLITRRSR